MDDIDSIRVSLFKDGKEDFLALLSAEGIQYECGSSCRGRFASLPLRIPAQAAPDRCPADSWSLLSQLPPGE